MSSYESLPKRSKIAAPQHGRRRVSIHDRSSVGCPKVLEVWVPNSRWSSLDVKDFLESLYDFASKMAGVDRESLYFEP